MSAFMVDNVTINRVVTHLDKFGGCKLLGFDGPAELGQAMFELNLESLREKYTGEDNALAILHYQYEPAEAKPVQVYKSLRCWLYQCSVRSDLLDRLDDWGSTLNISPNSIAYRDAEWG